MSGRRLRQHNADRLSATGGERRPGAFAGAIQGPRRRAAVRVPATTANLGPGFDALGLALDLHEEVWLERLTERQGAPRITVSGLNAGRLREDINLLAFRGVRAVYDALERPMPVLALELKTRIPRSGGLGGSAAALVGGLAAANVLEGNPLSRDRILELATAMEGHPDNVAPAILGGLVVCVHGRDGLITKRITPPKALRAVLVVPDQSISTHAARSVVPRQYSREDAIFNLGRTALLVSAFLTQDWALLRDAMDDRIHQPYRGQVYGALFPVLEAALGAGAHGAALSGSGSAILALASERHQEIGAAMLEAARSQGFPGKIMILRLSAAGASLAG